MHHVGHVYTPTNMSMNLLPSRELPSQSALQNHDHMCFKLAFNHVIQNEENNIYLIVCYPTLIIQNEENNIYLIVCYPTLIISLNNVVIAFRNYINT